MTQSNNFDIIIIGGGPAGAMCGIELQKQGFKTCILDKASFPRTKLCGGLLTQKTLDLLKLHTPNIHPENFVLNSTKSVDFYKHTQQVCSLKSNIPFYFTERSIFDYELIKEYKRIGGHLIENCRIKKENIDLKNKHIQIEDDRYQYKYLIGADGCNSVLLQKARVARNDLFCIEGVVKTGSSIPTDCRIYFNSVKNGYGWYFPKDKHYTIGLGGDNKNKNLKKDAECFFKEAEVNQVEQIKGAFIPSGKLPNIKQTHDNTIPIGDAIGMVDPITGEGLYYALWTGIQAAHTILEASHLKKENVKDIYLKKIEDECKDISFAYKLQLLLFKPWITKIFLNILKTHKAFAQFYLEEVMSLKRVSYRKFILHYLFHIKFKAK